jgi:hypothetical protein
MLKSTEMQSINHDDNTNWGKIKEMNIINKFLVDVRLTLPIIYSKIVQLQPEQHHLQWIQRPWNLHRWSSVLFSWDINDGKNFQQCPRAMKHWQCLQHSATPMSEAFCYANVWSILLRQCLKHNATQMPETYCYANVWNILRCLKHSAMPMPETYCDANVTL